MVLGSTGVDRLDGEGGIDTLSFATFTGDAITLDLGGPQGSYGTTSGSTGVLFNFENYILSGGNDFFTGTSGDDTVDGGDGDDTFFGSAGADTFNGEGDSDTVDYSTLASSVVNVSVTLNDIGTSSAVITLSLIHI